MLERCLDGEYGISTTLMPSLLMSLMSFAKYSVVTGMKVFRVRLFFCKMFHRFYARLQSKAIVQLRL